MEKISALIDKLQELKNANASLQSISYYVQLLQAEILHARSLERERERELQRNSSSHVAVIMPTTSFSDPVIDNIAGRQVTASQTNTVHSQPASETVQVIRPEARPVVEVIKPASKEEPVPVVAVHEPEVPKVEVKEKVEEIEEKPLEIKAPEEKKPVFITLFGNPEEPVVSTNRPEIAPTNDVRRELKELNQKVAQQSTLNDRLRQSQVELADRLGDMPVKDLRHAIGINDKFQFIQELFRGDVDTYERSLKTINEMHSIQEAEYWIERELKIRQGWDDDNRVVRQFYNLVKKRFS